MSHEKAQKKSHKKAQEAKKKDYESGRRKPLAEALRAQKVSNDVSQFHLCAFCAFLWPLFFCTFLWRR